MDYENQTQHRLLDEIKKLRKQLEETECKNEKLKKKNEELSLYSSMINQSLDGIFFTDKDFKVTYINRAAEELYGWTSDDLKGKTPYFFNAETSADKIQDDIYSTVSGGKTYTGESLNRKKDGSTFMCRYKISPVFDADGIICGYMGSLNDITQSKNAFEILHESEEYLRVALESGGEGMWEYYIKEGIIELDSAALKMLGFSESNAPRNANFWWHRIHSEDYKSANKTLLEHIEGLTDCYSTECRMKTKNNEWKWIASHGKIIKRDQDNDALLIVGTFRDITEQKLSEKALRDSEDRFKMLFEFAPDAYFLCDLKGTFVDGNKTAEKLFGYNKDELIGKTFIKFLPASSIPKATAIILQNVFGKATGPDEFTIHRKDGSKIILEISTYPIDIKEKVLVLGIARDITERKESEKLIRIQRDVALALSATRDMETALTVSLEHAIKLDNVSCSGIYLLDEATGALNLACYAGISEKCAAKLSHFGSDSNNTRLIMKGKSVFTGIDNFDLEQSDNFSNGNKKLLAIIPLKHKKSIIGSLHLIFKTSNDITSGTKSTLETLASQITGVILRIRAEKALRESEERLFGFLNSASDAFYLLDNDLNFIEINEQGLKMIDKKRNDVIGKNISQIIPDNDGSGNNDEYLEALRSGNIFKIKDLGSQSVYKESNYILKSFKVGDGLGVISTDVSEIKKAEKALKESEEKYRLLLESTPDIIMRFDKKLCFTYVSSSIINFTGIESEKFIGRKPGDMELPNELKDHWEKKIKNVLKTGKSETEQFILDQITEDKIFDWRLIPEFDSDGKVTSVYTTARDITEQKHAENALRESEERLRAIFTSSPDAIVTTDIDGTINSCNHALIQLYQCDSEEDLINQKVLMLVAQRDRQLAQDNFNKFIQTGELKDRKFMLRTKYDEEFPAEVSASFIKNIHGNIISVVAVVKDIRDREKTADALKAERDRATMYFNIAGVMLIVIRNDQTVNLINEKGCEILGYTTDEIIGKNWFDNFIPKDQINSIKEVFVKLVAGEIENVKYSENKVVTKSGETRDIAWHNTIIKDESGKITGTLSSGEDITERIKAEKERTKLQRQLLQAQKMESIGRLAGGIAHDFNNLLTVISGSCELILMNVDHDRIAHEDIIEIKKSADRAANLTRQLLAFSRRQVIEPQVINLNDLILNMEKMLKRLIGEDLEFVTVTAKDLWPVNVDPGQIEQVLTNLVVNARDAMYNGGTLTIETANITLDENYTYYHPDTGKGDYAMLAVSDTGAGMDDKTLSHIFEPFFTTKEKGKGTGLGLSTCYGIVKQNRGNIWVYSEPGYGTTIKVYLPKVEYPDNKEIAQKEYIKILTGTETILVVEDEPSVLKMTTRILRNAGYTVYTATNGEEALRGLDDKSFNGINLIITDVIMPRMGGKELQARLQGKYDTIKILFMSGYTDDSIVHQGILESGLSFIQKPFSPDTLIEKVREVLNSQ